MYNNDFTTPEYWAKRQRDSHYDCKDISLIDLVNSILSNLKEYENTKFLELGCSPGIISSIICRKLKIIPYGIDNSPNASLYLKNLENSFYKPTLYICDIRNFQKKEKFDVVASFGLIEHFKNPNEIIKQHDQLCKKGGLIIISVPNFQYLQFIYHYIFDRKDLKNHNLKIMTKEFFLKIALSYHHEILSLNYIGRINFWNYNLEGGKLVLFLTKLFSLIVRYFTRIFLSNLIPCYSKYYSPWIVYIAKKK